MSAPTVSPSATTGPLPGAPIRGRSLTRWVVAGQMLLVAVLGLAWLGDKSFWIDEAYTWSTVSRGFGDLVELMLDSEANAALHSLLLLGWVRVGDSEVVLRLPSVLFAVLSVPAVYLLARRLFDERTGLIAGFLVAVSATMVEFAQEARSYTLVVLFAALSGAFLAAELREPTRRTWWGWVVASTLLLYAHVYGAFVLLAQAVSLLFLPPAALRWRRLLGAGAAVAVAAGPYLLVALLQDGWAAHYEEFLPAPGLADVRRIVATLAGSSGSVMVAVYGLASLGALASTWMAWRRRGRSREVWAHALLVAWIVLPLVIVFVLSSSVATFQPRHLLVSLPALVVLGARGLALVGSPRLLVPILVGVALVAAWGVRRYYVDVEKTDFRAGTAFVAERAQEGDGMLFALDENLLLFEYYLRDDPATRAKLTPAFPDVAWGGYRTGDQMLRLFTEEELLEASERFDRLWVVLSFAEPGEVRARLELLEPTHELVDDRRFDGDFWVLRYERA
ncbi:MAG: glycosyltransferase family 39 protein [Acidimicrobiia bacterium]|nr:glycosyltransferase family 39 protein [Acidimicrobiia bacterium]